MTDLFDENKNKELENKEQSAPAEGDAISTYLGLMLNENGEQKYTNTEEALKGAVNAQSHISTLESELKELREKAEKNVGMEDILSALQSGKTEKPSEGLPETSGISPEDLSTAINQIMDSRQSESTQSENIASVTGVFLELYGEKASETMYSKAKDLGLTGDEINGLIAINPKAALKILEPEASKKKTDNTLESGHSVENLGGRSEEVSTIMGATSHKDLTSAWEASKAATLERLDKDGLI